MENDPTNNIMLLNEEIKDTESILSDIEDSIEKMYYNVIKSYTSDSPVILNNMYDGKYKFTNFMKENSKAYCWFHNFLIYLYEERDKLNNNFNIRM